MTEEGKKESILSALREQIQKGEFGARGRIPTIAQLARTHGVARTTVYQVLETLLIEGVLIPKDNSYYVNYPPMRIPGAPVFDKYLESQGITPVVDSIVAPEVITMPDEIADLFKATKGIRVVHLVRKHGTVDIPMRLAENWYPAELAEQFLEALRYNPGLNVAGEIRKAHGLSITKVSEDLISRLPDAHEMELLSIVRCSPVLESKRTFLSSDDKVILYNKTVLVATFFSLHYDYPIPVK